MGTAAFLVVLFVGWFALAKWQLGKGRRKVLVVPLTGLLAFVVAACVGAYIDGPTPAAKSPPSVATATAAPKAVAPASSIAAPIATLGISLSSYVERFNTMNHEAGTPYRLHPDVKRAANGNGVFTSMMSDNIGIVGTVNSHDELLSVMFVAGGDGTVATNELLINTLIASLAAAIDNTDIRDVQPTVVGLISDGLAHIKKGEKTIKLARIINGVSLTMSVAPDAATAFTAEPVADPLAGH